MSRSCNPARLKLSLPWWGTSIAASRHTSNSQQWPGRGDRETASEGDRAKRTRSASAGGVMTDRITYRIDERSRYSAWDVVAVTIYSVLVLLLMLAWAYVPA